MNRRKVDRIQKSKPTVEGAGVRLKRAFGYNEAPMLDPFLMLDDFHSGNPNDYIMGFPWHPHRGIETVTYMLEGSVEHGDSMGNKGVIESGDIQWMTAGNGIIHQEMPKGKNGNMWGFQLWVNLPSRQKMMDPRYREVKREEIPEVELDGGIRVKVISGEVGGVRGPVRDIVVDPEYLDVSIQPGAIFEREFKNGYKVFAYVIDGSGDFAGEGPIDGETLVIFGDGAGVRMKAGEKGLRFLLVSGKPLGESVAWSGPIVMNTQEELELALKEYYEGTFIKHK